MRIRNLIAVCVISALNVTAYANVDKVHLCPQVKNLQVKYIRGQKGKIQFWAVNQQGIYFYSDVITHPLRLHHFLPEQSNYLPSYKILYCTYTTQDASTNVTMFNNSPI